MSPRPDIFLCKQNVWSEKYSFEYNSERVGSGLEKQSLLRSKYKIGGATECTGSGGEAGAHVPEAGRCQHCRRSTCNPPGGQNNKLTVLWGC